MKRDRNQDSISQATGMRQNNTAAIGGYDAYFGTYQVNEGTNKVAHTLVGSVNPRKYWDDRLPGSPDRRR
jgi:hypothetical protein